MKINFEKISWQQILIVCKVVRLSSSSNLETIARWYNSESTNFDDTSKLLIDIGVINIKNNKVNLTSELKEVIKLDNESIRQFFVNILFKNESHLVKYFGNFFDSFVPSENSYRVIPTIEERLKNSGVRNFLIGLGALQFESATNSYLVREDLAVYLFHKNKFFAYDQFEKKIKSEKELGLAAETLVYNSEKDKFKNRKNLQKNIRHISLENVMAGYDVQSYEERKDSKIIPKYIEVKAVSQEDWKFYWSRNEINKAKSLRESYYLYLVPVKDGKTLNISNLHQIKNPYNEVFLNKREWTQEIETISFFKSN
jgi:hypothetical protein